MARNTPITHGTASRLWCAVCVVIGLGIAAANAAKEAVSPSAGTMAAVIDIQGAIGPATADYVTRSLDKAADRGAALVVLRMDTPGGLDSSMREIIKAILRAPMPVVSFVPAGGRAASAGTYISYASHVAAMAPGASLGAATPVQIGGGGLPTPKPSGENDPAKDGKDNADKDTEKKPESSAKEEGGHPDVRDKAVNDAIAYIRSLAEMRGRNVEWAEEAVRRASSLGAQDALAQNVIDLIADDVPDLLAKLDGRTVSIHGRDRVLETAGMSVTEIAPDWRSEFLDVITNPSMAYILMMIGIYGIIFEFYSPGLAGPGIVGAICLLLGLYALHLLPVNYAGAGLVVLGLALMIAETVMPSFGILGIGGIVAFVIGSVMLFDTDAPGYGVSWHLIAAIAATSGGLFLFVGAMLMRSRRRAVVSGVESMIGETGRVIEWRDGRGRVRAHGEIWFARGPAAAEPGSAVRINRVDGLTLEVEPET